MAKVTCIFDMQATNAREVRVSSCFGICFTTFVFVPLIFDKTVAYSSSLFFINVRYLARFHIEFDFLRKFEPHPFRSLLNVFQPNGKCPIVK